MRFVFQNCSDLPFLHALEPVQKLFRGGPATKVLEKGVHGYPGPRKDPGAADFVRMPFYRRARIPVRHTVTSLPSSDSSLLAATRIDQVKAGMKLRRHVESRW